MQGVCLSMACYNWNIVTDTRNDRRPLIAILQLFYPEPLRGMLQSQQLVKCGVSCAWLHWANLIPALASNQDNITLKNSFEVQSYNIGNIDYVITVFSVVSYTLDVVC